MSDSFTNESRVLRPSATTRNAFSHGKLRHTGRHHLQSRSTTVAAELMRATDGCSVDVTLNSLTGHLLDESWRCIANGGTMGELGKKVSWNPVANGIH